MADKSDPPPVLAYKVARKLPDDPTHAEIDGVVGLSLCMPGDVLAFVLVLFVLEECAGLAFIEIAILIMAAVVT